VHAHLVTSVREYSDPAEEDGSFDRGNYCDAPGLSVPSSVSVNDRGEVSAISDSAPFYHKYPDILAQDLCWVHVSIHIQM
jgi:hypothetical protein